MEKKFKGFEDSIGAFMVQWIQVIVDEGVTESYLEVLVNMIKYNAAHLENNDLVGIVQYVKQKILEVMHSLKKIFFQKRVLPKLSNRRHKDSFTMSSGSRCCFVLQRYSDRDTAIVHCCLMSHC